MNSVRRSTWVGYVRNDGGQPSLHTSLIEDAPMTFAKISQLACVASIAVCLGCGGGGDQKKTAKVTGAVTYGGNPVTGGSLTFAPKAEGSTPGKTGTGAIGEDGTYTVSTYGNGDGAVIGEHTITYSAPAGESAPAGDGGGHAATKPSKFEGLVPKETKVTVLESGNTIDIELVKP